MTMKSNPIWRMTTDDQAVQYPTLSDSQSADVVIIGAGITGLTAALELQQGGKKVIVLERWEPGNGTTGANSGHLNTAIDTLYHKLISKHGLESAKLVYKETVKALDYVERTSQLHNIASDFTWETAYTYAEVEDEKGDLEDEFIGANEVGLKTEWHNITFLPYPVYKACKQEGQAKFHPLKYILGLAKAFTDLGGEIYGNSPLIKNEHSKSEGHKVTTPSGSVSAPIIIMATGIPVGFHPVHSRAYPYMSYCVAVKCPPSMSDFEGLIYDTKDPYHYIRYINTDEGKLLIIGGEDHKTGHDEDTEVRFQSLEAWVKEKFGPEAVTVTRWSSQFYETSDSLPFIGAHEIESNFYYATGYSGNGLTWGTIAGRHLANIILGKDDKELTNLLSPSRFKPLAGAVEFAKENFDVALNLVGDYLKRSENVELNDIKPGDGKIINVDGKKTAVFHSEDGSYHAMSPICAHLGCHVHFNNAEKTWDCPCHGSRFTGEGKVIFGPVLRDLEGRKVSVVE